MPLKIKTFNAPHVAVLNNWADQQENTTQSHTKQLANISTLLDNLFKANPTLAKPNSK